jgi:N-acyl-D-amino-acid deacylase
VIDGMRTAGEFRDIEWENVLISDAPAKRQYQGQTIAHLALASGKDPFDWTVDALLEADLEVGMVLFEMSEENLQVKLRHPAIMIGTDAMGCATDGPLSEGVPHPREYGTYPRILGRYVREYKLLTLEEAIWKMTGFPAQKLGWTDRGQVRAGCAADLVIFDPQTVLDRATFAEPHQYPAGIIHVLVNGKLVVHEERHTGARPGQTL